jgi:hypothetical protein
MVHQWISGQEIVWKEIHFMEALFAILHPSPTTMFYNFRYKSIGNKY